MALLLGCACVSSFIRMALQISRILHAGYLFKHNQTQVAFDPIFENPFSQNCYAFPEIAFDVAEIKKLKLDAVFISHYHDDHCSLESLNLLNRHTPIYLYCVFEEMFDMIRELGFTKVYSLEIDQKVTIGAIEIVPRRALDADVDSIFHIHTEGLNILNVVDSWMDEETLRLLAGTKWDLILWPFQTMRELEVLAPSQAGPSMPELPEEWLQQLTILNPKYLIPSSCQFLQEQWSWYNHAFFPITYKYFAEEIAKILPQTKVIRLNPGKSVVLEASELQYKNPLPWIRPIGEQDVDYHFTPQLAPPTTAEIAKHFSSLTHQQTQDVIDFCENGLIEKFNSLEDREDPDFNNPRVWRLSLFDNKGQETHFFYNVCKGKIERIKFSESSDWTTEVPLTKIYGALKNGESLTSMYVRIHNPPFEDIIEDPLIRSLFTGVFGAYQQAQLRRIKNQS